MRKLGLFGILLLLAVALMGCGPSLQEYFAKANNYYSNVSTTARVSVSIAPPRVSGGNSVTTTGKAIAGVNFASAIAASAVSSEQQKRLQTLIQSDKVAVQIKDSFNESFTAQTQLPVVETSNPDVRILLTVRDYGLNAKTSGSEMYFFLDTQVKVIDVASTTTLYDEVLNVWYPVSQFASGGNVGTVYNLVSFFLLGDNEIQAVFDQLAQTAGIEIANALIKEIYG